MPRSRTALLQLLDVLRGNHDGPIPPWTHRPAMGTRNVVEMWLLTTFFVFFAWAGGFEILRHWMPAVVALAAALPAAFLILHTGPAVVGLIPGVRPSVASAASVKRRVWWCEEWHLWAATAYAGFSQLAAARWIFRVWLVLAALNVAAFLVLLLVRAICRTSAHA